MIHSTVPSEPHWIFRASLPRRWSANLVNVKYVAFLLAATLASAATLDMAGRPREPFAVPVQARVFIFVRTDCPITNRYAPELQRLSEAFAADAVQFWLVYPDPSET